MKIILICHTVKHPFYLRSVEVVIFLLRYNDAWFLKTYKLLVYIRGLWNLLNSAPPSTIIISKPRYSR